MALLLLLLILLQFLLEYLAAGPLTPNCTGHQVIVLLHSRNQLSLYVL